MTQRFPVLAYPSSDAASPVSVSLVLKSSEPQAQVTLSLLQSSILLQGFDDTPTFVLQYDADNVVPGTISLRPAAIALPQARLDEIARPGRPQVRTLSLRLKSCCPIWGPLAGTSAPQPGFEDPFTQFANLARATELCILFDYRWLYSEVLPIFQRLVEHPEQLSGFPVARYYEQHYKRENTSIFDLPKYADATVESDAVTGVDEPPAYAEASSSKRPRHVSTSPSAPSPPTRKRILRSPHYTEHILSSPEKVSKLAPNPAPPYSLASAPEFLHAVRDAVSQVLPSVLDSVLPTLLTAPSSSPSPSMSSQTSLPPAPLALTPLGILLGATLKRKLEDMAADMLYDASQLRSAADIEFMEDVDNAKLELAMEKEDCVAELEKAVHKNVDAFREQCGHVEEAVQERVEWLGMEAVDNVREKVEAEREKMGREIKELEKERRRLGIGNDGKGVRRGCRCGGGGERSRRAESAPL